MDGAGSYSVAHRAGLLPTELTGMWGWILLRSPRQGRGSPPAPAPTEQRPVSHDGPFGLGGGGVRPPLVFNSSKHAPPPIHSSVHPSSSKQHPPANHAQSMHQRAQSPPVAGAEAHPRRASATTHASPPPPHATQSQPRHCRRAHATPRHIPSADRGHGSVRRRGAAGLPRGRARAPVLGARKRARVAVHRRTGPGSRGHRAAEGLARAHGNPVFSRSGPFKDRPGPWGTVPSGTSRSQRRAPYPGPTDLIRALRVPGPPKFVPDPRGCA